MSGRSIPPVGSLPSLVPVSIKAQLRDLCDNRGRDEAVDRFSPPDQVANLVRGDRERLDLEELDAIGPAQPGQHLLEDLAGIAGPRGDAEPGELDDVLRAVPDLEEACELVGADKEERILEAPGLEELDRPRVRIELDVVFGEGGARQLDPVLNGSRDVLVA